MNDERRCQLYQVFFQKWKGDGKKSTNKEYQQSSIWKFPDYSSVEQTRHVPIDKKQDGPS